MKRFLISASALVLVGGGALAMFRSGAVRAQQANGESPREISAATAESLQRKIDLVKQEGQAKQQMEVFEAELKSYVLFAMKDDIPVQIDSFDVHLDVDTVAADAQITMPSGKGLIDVVVGGTHTFFFKGALKASDGRGRFDLSEVKVDGIPVPKVLVEALFANYVTSKYPDADLQKPFDLPWDIQSIGLQPGKATIAY